MIHLAFQSGVTAMMLLVLLFIVVNGQVCQMVSNQYRHLWLSSVSVLSHRVLATLTQYR